MLAAIEPSHTSPYWVKSQARGRKPTHGHNVLPGQIPGVQVWTGSLDLSNLDLDYISQFLSVDEWERARQFRFPQHQQRFISGRGLLRLLLAQALHCTGEEIRFGYTDKGKPFLIGPIPGALHFNASHTESRLCVALAPNAVGVDIEIRRPIDDCEALVEQVCSPAEREVWDQIPAHERNDAFLNLWTRKEALLKGLGQGITEHLQDVSVFFDERFPVRIPSALHRGASWNVRSLDLGPGLAAALALPGDTGRSSDSAPDQISVADITSILRA